MIRCYFKGGIRESFSDKMVETKGGDHVSMEREGNSK